MPFMSSDDMLKLAGSFSERAFGDPKIAEKVNKEKITIRFVYTCADWDSSPMVTIILGQGEPKIELGNSDAKADVTMTQDVEIAHLFWMKKLNPVTAIARGRIKPEGNFRKALRLLPYLKPIYAHYEDVLKEMGRDDLIEFAKNK